MTNENGNVATESRFEVEQGAPPVAKKSATKTPKKKTIKPVLVRYIKMRIVGISPLITHSWGPKKIAEMRAKMFEGVKTKNRDIRDADKEGESATYRTPDGKPGLRAVSIKAAVIEAAHMDMGIPKVRMRKALFIMPFGKDMVLPLETVSGEEEIKPEYVEDLVILKNGAPDLRYRPYYYDWAVTLRWQIDKELVTIDEMLILLDRAGFGVGLNEWRPSSKNGGEYGRFRVDENFEVIDSPTAEGIK